MKSDESYLGFEVQKIGGSRKDTVLQVVELKQIYRNAFRSFEGVTGSRLRPEEDSGLG